MNDDNIETTKRPPTPANVVPFKRVTLKVVANEADPLVVAFFERYLAAAKAGKIKFAALATVDDENVAITSWMPEKTSGALISAALGAVHFLNHRFVTAVDDCGEESDKYDA